MSAVVDDKLTSLISDTLGVAPECVTTAFSREADEWDSLNHLRLITAVEEAYGAKFTMAEIQSIATVADLWTLLHKQAES